MSEEEKERKQRGRRKGERNLGGNVCRHIHTI